jgi:RNA polymerase sigma factor (sigma-70 family)
MAITLRVDPVSSDCSDVELVEAVRRGNDGAFEELYSRYGRRIGAYVRGMVADHGRAEDITQEIFIAALRRMRDTDRPIAFKPWIYEIAKNACIDNFRRTRRAQEVSLDADDGLSLADRGRLTVVTTPDAALDTKQALEDLRGAFGGLSHSHHQILVLRELEGRSYSDIGERLGMSRPVVESTLFRARRRLAEEYDELTSGRRCEFVRKMIDSGPQYSLGIRDRRRMARHFAHCNSCRAYARMAGFDVSMLNMPGVVARIAALVPVPLLRARWGGAEHISADRARPSALAWRSVQTLARSSDQVVVAGPGVGRGAATAAALVLAGVGGGVVTVSSSQPPTPQRSVVRGVAHGDQSAVAVRDGGRMVIAAPGPKRSPHAGKKPLSSTGGASTGAAPSTLGGGVSSGAGMAGRTSSPVVAPGSSPTDLDSDGPGVVTSTGGAGGSTPAANGGGGDPTASPTDPSNGTGGSGAPTVSGSSNPANPTTAASGAPTAPPLAGSSPTGTVTGTVDSTLGAVTSAVPQLPATVGIVAGSHSDPRPIGGAITGVAKGLLAQNGRA